jgi:hypothetical protein
MICTSVTLGRGMPRPYEVRSDTLLSQGAGDVIADVIERIGGGPDLLDLGAGGIQFRPVQCGLPYFALGYGECGRRKSCKCMCALKRTVEQDAGIDSVVDQAASGR